MIWDFLFSDPLPEGSEAPPVRLRDERGNLVDLASHRGLQNVVLVFYPADDTPG
jgi:peroxiredoxin